MNEKNALAMFRKFWPGCNFFSIRMEYDAARGEPFGKICLARVDSTGHSYIDLYFEMVRVSEGVICSKTLKECESRNTGHPIFFKGLGYFILIRKRVYA